MRGTFKLTTIECAVCAGVIDVFQEVDPEVTVWRVRDEEENTCQRPPVTSCPQARTEVLRMYPERHRRR